MKKTGILNRELSDVIASLGHLDLIVISDAGLPVAPSARRVELALAPDLPTVPQILEILLQEAVFEKISFAEEQITASPIFHERLKNLVGKIPLEALPHYDGFKPLAERAKVHIRTGDFTPYANLVLTAGWIGRSIHAGEGDA
jgi:D-ribose pyranase